jgi:hypothetical protein
VDLVEGFFGSSTVLMLALSSSIIVVLTVMGLDWVCCFGVYIFWVEEFGGKVVVVVVIVIQP